MQGTRTYRVEAGALVDVPVWEGHLRGKNWLAVIERDPLCPRSQARVPLAWRRARRQLPGGDLFPLRFSRRGVLEGEERLRSGNRSGAYAALEWTS